MENKNIIIKNIKIENFENIKSFEYEFNQLDNVFEAKNGSGKTSIKKAFLFLLGLDVGFVNPILNCEEILDEKGEPLETVVEGNVLFDNLSYNLKRKQKSSFVLDKATGDRTKKGNVNLYYVDNCKAMTLNAYEQFFKDKLGVNFETLYLLADIDRFNTDNPPKWKWDNRRVRLEKLCNIEVEISKIDTSNYSLLKDDLAKDKKINEIKSDTKSKLLLSNTRLAEINGQIVTKSEEISKYTNYDFNSIRSNIVELGKQLLTFTKTNAKANTDILIAKLNEDKSKYINEKNRLSKIDREIFEKYDDDIDYKKSEIKRLENTNRDFYIADTYSILAQIKAIGEETWTGGTICPTCKQSLPKDQIDFVLANFESHKKAQVKELNERLEKAKETNKYNDTQKIANNTKIETLKGEISDLEFERCCLEPNPQIAEIDEKISNIDEKINSLISTNYNDSVNDEETKIKNEIAAQNQLLAYETFINERNNEIKTLSQSKIQVASENVALIKKQEQLQKYTDKMMEIVQAALDNWLKGGVSFMLYTPTYSGELKETCIAAWKNRTYDIMSRGEKIHTNIEIQKALQKAYGIIMPIWIDDFESFTEDYEINTQHILLYAIRNKEIVGLTKIIADKKREIAKTI